MSLFDHYVDIIAERYGENVGKLFREANSAINDADKQDEGLSLSVRLKNILALVELINASGGLSQHSLVTEKYSHSSVRISLNDEHGLVWRNYVFEKDFMFNLAQVIANHSPS
ncbi:hypothetical protein AGJ34_21225 [Cronobacter dublinensis subsp. dublinensis]|nr:hypothetical protein [Cronobacter dublinensis subsp. dublinensis]